MTKVNLRLMHGNLKYMLLNSPEIKNILEEVAKDVESKLPSAVADSNSMATTSTSKSLKNKLRKQKESQTFGIEHEKSNDRQKFMVFIKNVRYSDFMFGSLQKALAAAGGKQTRKGRKYPARKKE